jgi:hypothetical protein
MLLRPGGIDVFYIDESHDKTLYAVTAVAVPFIRPIEGVWNIVWPDYLAAAKEWRRRIADDHKIPTRKELHGWKLVSGRGNYLYGSRQLKPAACAPVYQGILSKLDWLPEASIITVAGRRGRAMYGHARLERVMHALFQRMRRQAEKREVNAMVFFDQGHPEYRSLYRRAMVNLPTGSRYGPARNLPLDAFIKDGNEKNSKHCLFTQAADVVAYAALSKFRHELGLLDPDQEANALHTIFDGLPEQFRNLAASGRGGDGIVRLDP